MTTTAIQEATDTPSIPTGMTELDERSFDGLTVRLIWSTATNEIFVQRIDMEAIDETEFETFHKVPNEHARQGFEHPTFYPTVDLRNHF